jgi:CHAT domain-containing protein
MILDSSMENRSAIKLLCFFAVLVCNSGILADEASTKFEQAIAAVAKINDLKLPDEQRQQVLGRWFRFGGTIARQECNAALQAGNLTKAETWAEKEDQLASECLTGGDKTRVASSLNLAKVQFLQEEKRDASLKTFQTTAQLATTGKHLDYQIEAMMGIAAIQLARNPKDLTSVSNLLKMAQQQEFKSPLYANSILFVWSRVWFPIYQKFGRTGEFQNESYAKLKFSLENVSQQLTDEGVEENSAKAGMLLLPRLALDLLDFESARVELKNFESPERLNQMPAFWRVQLLSLHARLASELSLFAEARSHLTSAIEIASENNLGEQVAVLQISLGELLIRQGDYSAAEDVLRDTVDLYEKHPRLQHDPQRPVALSDLAKTYEGRGRYSRAEDLYEEAIKLLQQQTPIDTLRISMVRNNQAANFYMAGKFDASREVFTSVLQSLQTRLGSDHLRVAELYANLGWLAMESGNATLATEYWKTSLDGIRKAVGDDHPRAAEIMSYQARAKTTLDNHDEAAALLTEALDLREQHLKRTLRSALSERDRLAIIQELRVHPESAAWPGVFDTWLELADKLKTPVEVQYERVLRWKGSLDRFHIDASATEGAPAELLERRSEVLAQLRTTYFGTSSDLSRREQRELVARLESQANSLEREIRQASSITADDLVVSVAEVQKRIPKGAALLDVIQIRRYARREEGEEVQDSREYVGFLLIGDEPIRRIGFGPVEEFDKTALEFYEDISSGNPDFTTSGAKLNELIRVPLEEALRTSDTLIVSGDGLFHMLPLGAIPGKNEDSVWLDDLAFVSLGNVRDLVASSTSQQPTENSQQPLRTLVVGGVDYGERQPDVPRQNWAHLPGTAEEAEAIIEQLRTVLGSDLVTSSLGVEATEPEITNLLQDCQLIHLATHGFFGGSSRRPGDAFEVIDITAEMDSAIVLAGANTPSDESDNLLTAEELGNQNLKHVRLLVLSACQTGLGHVRAGQGVVGLLGTLGRAGVRSIVSSLWEVNDEATAKLMTAFYKELSHDSSALGLARSLRQAQLKLRRGEISPEGGGSFKHPRFWAPFFLSGSPNGIDLNPAR